MFGARCGVECAIRAAFWFGLDLRPLIHRLTFDPYLERKRKESPNLRPRERWKGGLLLPYDRRGRALHSNPIPKERMKAEFARERLQKREKVDAPPLRASVRKSRKNLKSWCSYMGKSDYFPSFSMSNLAGKRNSVLKPIGQFLLLPLDPGFQSPTHFSLAERVKAKRVADKEKRAESKTKVFLPSHFPSWPSY